MTRKIIIPKSESLYIKIPKKYINQKVEILVLPFDNHIDNTSQKIELDIIKRTKGLLSSAKIDPIKWQKNLRDEYER